MSFKVPEHLLSYVNDGIIGKLQAKNITFYLPNKIELDDVELLDEHGARVLYAKRVKLTLSLLSLLTKNITITDAFIDSPFFHYTIIKGIHNVISPFASPPHVVVQEPESSSKVRVTIENVNVENGRYEMYHDAGVRIFADGLMADGSFWVENGSFGISIRQADIKKGSIHASGMTLPITNLTAKKLWISDEKVATDSLVLLYEHAKIIGRGTVFIKEDRYDVRALIDAPLGTYPAGLTPLPFVAPAFTADVEMAGPLSEPEFVATINHLATTFKGLKIKEGKAQVQFNQYQVVGNSVHHQCW